MITAELIRNFYFDISYRVKDSTKCKIVAFSILVASIICVLYISVKDIVTIANHDSSNPNSTLQPIPLRMHG
ncbi:hypothetical protein CEXT_388581 [Caerostris extrusa]|uniref:Uncharacterized protein n=1 Tax=Caerostris extrusa TaxID=172846 RepID=A0AAV4WB79_CAEEX|nr:hypothetical protein CEXT_388581 [Caerostris extrusa]